MQADAGLYWNVLAIEYAIKKKINYQPVTWSVSNTCTAREQHLHGSRATLARLTSDTCTAHGRYLCGAVAVQTACRRVPASE